MTRFELHNMTHHQGLGMPFEKFGESARHMAESTIARLPSLILSVIVFLLFYALSMAGGPVILRGTRGDLGNLGIVFCALVWWGTTLVRVLLTVSKLSPSLHTV